MLLGQFHRHFVQNFAVVAVERGEQRAVTVHDDEAELVIRLEKLFERLRSHTCVTHVATGGGAGPRGHDD